MLPGMARRFPQGKLGVGANDDAEMLRAADRHRLERLARRLAADRAAMLEAMVQAQERGASLREIAQATGMSHTGVAKQLREHQRRKS